MNPAPTKIRFLVLAWLGGAMAFAYVARNTIAVAESTMRADLGLTKTESGWLMSAFFLSYAIFQIPGAEVGRRYGARFTLPVIAAIWSIATVVMAGLTGLLGLLAARIVQGIAQAALIPTSVACVSRWTSKEIRGFAGGSLGVFMSIGGALGIWFSGIALDSKEGWGWSWRSVFVVSAIPGILWALGFGYWFHNNPCEHPSVNEAEARLIEGTSETAISPVPQPAIPRPAPPWSEILTSPALWWICGQQMCRAAGYMFFTSWFATYLQETRHVSVAQSGLLTMMPLLGVVFGGLVGGILSDWLLQRTGSRFIARSGLSAVALLICAVLIVWAMYIETVVAAVWVITLGSFIASLAAPSSYAITMEMGGAHVAAINATMNMMGNLGAWAFPVAVPLLLSRFGSWDAVLGVFAAIYVLGAIFWWILRPEGNIVDQSLLRKRPHVQA